MKVVGLDLGGPGGDVESLVARIGFPFRIV